VTVVAAQSVPGSGLGLIGLAERVELVGGRLAHGTAEGRFGLEVRLPRLA
jgi:signal transduction histidine kinase